MSFRRAFDWTIWIVVRAFAIAYRSLGARAAYGIAAAAGTCWYVLFRGRRRIIHRNLEIAFGDALDAAGRGRIGRRACQHALATITDLALCDRLAPGGGWTRCFEADPVLDGALVSPHPAGLAILSAHLGSWEMGLAYCGLRGVPVSPVIRVLDNPYLHRASVDLRTRFGGEVIPKHGALRGILRVLRRGGCVAIVADQSAPPTERAVSFFGEPAYVHTSYAHVLVRQGCRVIFSVCVREGLAFRFRLESRELEVAAEGSLEERALRLVRSYHEALEDAVRAHPEQYLWMHRKWKRRPAGLPSLYEDLAAPLPRSRGRRQPARAD